MMNTKEKRTNTLVIVLVIIIILILLLGIKACSISKGNKNILDISENQIEANDPNLLSSSDNEYFEIVGYGQLEINENNKNINLINPSDNMVYLKFEVFNNDNLLHTTKLIQPGKMEQYDIYSILDAGKHTLTYSIDVVDIKTQSTTWSGIKQKQEILIKK